ncbi:MAG: PAS domain S-box protein [Desulfobacterales bacterium]|nr:PAS domain S-box protein [Desulfobacterales bacterium]
MPDGNVRILLVEDDDIDREAVARHIRKHNLPYDLRMAGSEWEAIEKLEDGEYDVVLLDYDLGSATGLDLLPRVGDTPAIFVTGSGSEEIAVRAMRRGACDYLIKDPDRNYLQVLPLTIQNVLERRKAEKALRESEARYRAIVEDQSELICRFNPDYILTFVNEVYARCWGKPAKEMIGMNVLTLFPDSIKNRITSFFTALSPEEPFKETEYKVLDGRGETRWQRWAIRAIVDDRGGVSEFQCVGRDITERKRTREALDASRKELRSIIETVPDIIYRLDAEGRITFISDAVKPLGYAPEKLLGAPFFDIVHPGDRKKASLKINERRADPGQIKSFELRLLKTNREPVPFEIFSIFTEEPLGSEEETPGVFMGTQGIARDVTKRKKAEEEREKVIQELQEALTEVELLSGLLPICSYCKKVRNDEGYWLQIENYIESHSKAKFSHGMCNECMQEHHPEIYQRLLRKGKLKIDELGGGGSS